MSYVVRMPQLGMTMEEGVVVEWSVEPGETFEEGDVIAVVESEKTTNDVEAREAGQILERFVDLEEAVGPGDPIAFVGVEGDEVPADVDAEAVTDEGAGGEEAAEADGAAESDETPAAGDAGAGAAAGSVAGDAKVSPRARAYARDNDIDEAALGDLDGSGPDGAVIEADVVAAADSLGGEAAAPDAGGAAGAPVSVSGRGLYEERGKSGMRRAIADRMTQGADVPQVTINRHVPADAMLDLKDRFEADRDEKLSVTDFLLSALVETLDDYPAFNAIYEDGTHKLAGNVNVGLAVDIEDGLVTPVVRGANRLSITEIREERQRLVSLVQSDEYTMDDLADGTITVTNLGHFGVESFDPILNPPEVAILGVNTIRSRYDPEADETVRELGLSLTFDHRALDGADAARFLDALADNLAHPLRLISVGHAGERAAAAEAEADSGPFRHTDEGPQGERTATTSWEGGMQATVRSRHFEWAVDEPEDAGGEDTAPSPVDQFVGSLASCLTLTIGHVADRRGVDIEDVSVTATAEPDHGKIERILVDVHTVSPESHEDIERVVQTAERACFVNQVVDPDIERDVTVTVEAP